MTLDRWRWATLGSLALAFVASVAATSLDTAIARVFFVVTIVGGIVAGAGLRGRRTQAAVAASMALLVVGQRVPGHPVADPPSPDWRAALESPDDYATVMMRLDLPEFRAAASRAERAWVYVCAEGFGGRDDALALEVRTDQSTFSSTLGAKDAIGARPRPEQGGMYRIPVPLETIRAASEATFSLRAPDGPVRVCGTHSVRPSWGEATSVLLRQGVATAPSPKGPGRWVIELRLVDPDDHLLIAWY